jgi:hypothetical protein
VEHQRHRDADFDLFLFLLNASEGSAQPHVLALYRNSDLRALLVGTHEECQVDIRLAYFHLFRPKLKSIQFCRGGLLGEQTSEVCAAFLNCITESLRSGEADIAVLNQIDMEGALCQAASTSSHWLCGDHVPVRNVTRFRDIPNPSPPFLSTLSRNERSHQTRREKKLLADYGAVRIECFTKPEDVQLMVELSEGIARKSHVRNLGRGFFGNRKVADRFRFEASHGWLRGYLLFLGDEPAAFWIGSLYEGAFYSDAFGHDPDHAKRSPGFYILLKVMEEMIDREGGSEVKTFDFGPDATGYKVRFSNREYTEATVYIFAPKLRAVFINVMRTATTAVNETAKSILSRYNLKARVNHLWARFARTGARSQLDQNSSG